MMGLLHQAALIFLSVLVTLATTKGHKYDTFNSNQLREIPVMNVPETIQYWGYPVEEHFVETDDGYILGVHRIPHGRVEDESQSGSTAGPAVFLAHALVCSSGQWVFGPPEKSLGFMLADAGYDVWLGNTRGNIYSRNHTTLDTCSSCGDFWSFGFEESGVHDYSAVIDHILNTTGQQAVHFAGHSMGTTQFMILLSERPEYNAKIKDAYLLGPAAYMTQATNPIFIIASLADDIQDLFHLFGQYEFLPHEAFISWLGHVMCNVEDHPIWTSLCSNLFFLIGGINPDQLNVTMIPVYSDHVPAGGSTRPFVHYAQLYMTDNEFVKYDYGNEKQNMDHYGTTKPPAYNLDNVRVPTALFAGDADSLADPADTAHLAQVLPNVIHHEVVDYVGWTHTDFATGIDADVLVYNTIVEMMNERNSDD